eukprot:scaffold158482_cov35-Tisochrysis_lutea.AAC.6
MRGWCARTRMYVPREGKPVGKGWREEPKNAWRIDCKGCATWKKAGNLLLPHLGGSSRIFSVVRHFVREAHVTNGVGIDHRRAAASHHGPDTALGKCHRIGNDQLIHSMKAPCLCQECGRKWRKEERPVCYDGTIRTGEGIRQITRELVAGTSPAGSEQST